MKLLGLILQEVGSTTTHIEIVTAIIGVVGAGLFIVWQTIRTEAKQTRAEFMKGLQQNTESIVKIDTKIEEWRPMWNWFVGGRKP